MKQSLGRYKESCQGPLQPPPAPSPPGGSATPPGPTRGTPPGVDAPRCRGPTRKGRPPPVGLKPPTGPARPRRPGPGTREASARPPRPGAPQPPDATQRVFPAAAPGEGARAVGTLGGATSIFPPRRRPGLARPPRAATSTGEEAGRSARRAMPGRAALRRSGYPPRGEEHDEVGGGGGAVPQHLRAVEVPPVRVRLRRRARVRARARLRLSPPGPAAEDGAEHGQGEEAPPGRAGAERSHRGAERASGQSAGRLRLLPPLSPLRSAPPGPGPVPASAPRCRPAPSPGTHPLTQTLPFWK